MHVYSHIIYVYMDIYYTLSSLYSYNSTKVQILTQTPLVACVRQRYVLNFLALLVQKYKNSRRRRCC